MKQINTYINEKLHITTKSNMYVYYPETKKELREIIIQRIKDCGPECNLNNIDVSNIEDMSDLFSANEYNYGNKIFRNFNGDISLWNVSNVKDMSGMFYGCINFNCDLSHWDVSNVKYMDIMFYMCREFNSDISQWNVKNVENIKNMFSACKNFNQNLDEWNVQNVEDMIHAFYMCPTKPKWYKK